jgi:hypothetical protein
MKNEYRVFSYVCYLHLKGPHDRSTTPTEESYMRRPFAVDRLGSSPDFSQDTEMPGEVPHRNAA